MNIKNDIHSFQDIQYLVNAFYTKVQQDELLAPIFNNIIKDDWPKHLEKMYRFWETLLLDKHTYYGAPFPPHSKLPIGHAHFERWLTLFTETVDYYFVGERAEEAKWRASKMAIIFESKLNYLVKKHNEIQA
jgi:hemoglobin